METQSIAREKHEGGYKVFYRLSATLYARKGERKASLPAGLLYGGTWSMLPTAAARHLYLSIACLDPIDDEEAYLQKIAGIDLESADAQTALEEQRARHPLSYRDLERISGLSHSTAVEAVRVLTSAIFGGYNEIETGEWVPPLALVDKRSRSEREPAWYALNREAMTYAFNAATLNSSEFRRSFRSQRWQKAGRACDVRNPPSDAELAFERLKHGRISAWQEAQDLACVREHEAHRLGLEYFSNRQLSALTGRSQGLIGQSAHITNVITPELLRRAGARPDELHQLRRAALYRVAAPNYQPGDSTGWRAALLSEILHTVV
jgi:hypothetical protein